MKDLTKGNIYKTFILFAIPMVLSGILTQCYSIVNTMIAGKLLGENALYCVGAISPLESFINSLFWGYGAGVGIYTAHLFGNGKFFRLKSVVINNFKMLSIALIVLSIILIAFRYQIYKFLNVVPENISECNKYFIVSVSGKVFVLFAINCIYVVNAIGDSLFPFLMSVLSTLLHILIAAISVIVFKTGVEGLAFGNVLSSTVTSVCYIFKLQSCFKKLRVDKHKVRLNFKVIKETCRFSVSTTIQQSIMYFAGFLLSPMVNSLGSAATASYTVSLRIYDINASVYQNSAKTIGTYTAQCFGAKKYNLLKKGLIVGFMQNLIFVLPFLLVSIFASNGVVMLFYTADASTVSINYTIIFLRFFLPFLIFNIIANMFHNFFRGIGHMKALLITSIASSVARITISWILIKPLGIYGYYIGWVMSWLFDGLAGIIIYRFGKWRKILKV